MIKFHREDSFTGSRIVGFEVEPLSVKHQYKGAFTTDIAKLNLLTVPVGPDLPPQPVGFKPGEQLQPEVIFTYDVKWEYSDIRWASRWDLYLYMGDDQIHWFSIINSLAIVLLLTGIVAMIMMRTLRRDFNRCGAAPRNSARNSARNYSEPRPPRPLSGTTSRTRRTCRRSPAGSSSTLTSSARRSGRSCCAARSAPGCSCSRCR